MILRDYLYFNKITLTQFCKEHNFCYATISQASNFTKKVGLNVAERVERATNGIVKATKEDWPNLSSAPKKVYRN